MFILQVVEVIAQGAFGNVLKVQREDDKQFYAMKVSHYIVVFFTTVLLMLMLVSITWLVGQLL